jgi:hypothetical protein
MFGASIPKNTVLSGETASVVSAAVAGRSAFDVYGAKFYVGGRFPCYDNALLDILLPSQLLDSH